YESAALHFLVRAGAISFHGVVRNRSNEMNRARDDMVDLHQDELPGGVATNPGLGGQRLAAQMAADGLQGTRPGVAMQRICGVWRCVTACFAQADPATDLLFVAAGVTLITPRPGRRWRCRSVQTDERLGIIPPTLDDRASTMVPR